MKKENYKHVPLFGLHTLAKKLDTNNAYEKVQNIFMGQTRYVDKALVDSLIKIIEESDKETIKYLKQYKKEML